MQQSRHQDAFAAAAANEAGPPVGQMILRRKWLLMFGLAVGAGLGYLYFTQQPAVFKSVVQILITPNRPIMPNEHLQSHDVLADAIETQCQIVMSPIVIANAVDNYGLADRPEFGSRPTALAMISEGLSVAPTSKTSRVIAISYLGSTPSETEAVVKAITESYRSFLGDSDRAGSDEAARLIAQAKEELLKDLQKLENEYRAFRAEVPLLGQGEEKVNPHAVRLADIEAEKTGLVLTRTQLQAKIDAISDALRRGGSREALSLMVNQLKEEGGAKSEAVSVAEALFPLLLERELLSENLGKDHPKVVAIEKQIALTREHLDSLLNLGGQSSKPRDLLDVYLDSMRYEIETTLKQEEKLAEIYEAENLKARQLDTLLNQDRQLREEIRRKDSVLDVVVKQLEQMSLFDTEGIRTQVIAEPSLGFRTPVQRTKYMSIGGALGLIFASIMAYLLEANDKSFRSPDDVREELGVPVVGHVPVISTKGVPSGTKEAASLCTVHIPKGQSAEAFRLVRTALFFGARSGNLKVVQVTSPDQGDGKSTMSANLAVAVAQSGRRTLLIDADMRRPTVHKLFGVSNEVGMSNVIGEEIEPSDAIHESVVANLSVLTCGPRPHNPAELLASNRFDEFLSWARDRYDFVIVDTPPLLAVSDPGNVASRVDGVLLALRLGKRARAKGREAREILDRIGANVLGVIINGVNARGDYGYQSGYQYTSASTVRYTYGDNYYSNEYVEDERRPGRPVNGRPSRTSVRDA